MKTTPLAIDQILDRLPHRYPSLLVDRVLEMDLTEKKVIALKNVTINEPFFTGHFPGRPIMPGVLILEALAQAAVFLTASCEKKSAGDAHYYFAGINNARFKQIVVPGDQLILNVKLKRSKFDIYCFEVNATVNEKIVTEAEITCAIKYDSQKAEKPAID